jgi:hypothetical protein
MEGLASRDRMKGLLPIKEREIAMYDDDDYEIIDYSHAARDLAELTEAKVARIRGFLDALDAALARDGLTKHAPPPLFRELRQAIADFDARQTLH